MNRQIKFRAWDESQKYMAYQGTHDLETIQSFMHHYGDKVLMQWTGLKDFLGFEIYEGDIVYLFSDGTSEVVRFEDGYFFPLIDCNPDEIHVVGNIYENKDWLVQINTF